MGASFHKSCYSCMKNQPETGEVSLNASLPNHEDKSEISGFKIHVIREKLEIAKQEFLTMYNEGLDGGACTVEIDKPDCKVSGKETDKGYVLKYQFKIPYTQAQFFELVGDSEKRPT